MADKICFACGIVDEKGNICNECIEGVDLSLCAWPTVMDLIKELEDEILRPDDPVSEGRRR